MQIGRHIDNFYSSLQDRIRPLGVKALATFGLFLALRFSFKRIASFYHTFLSSSHNLPRRYGRGSWAVITGGTDGIGYAYANQLASLGFNLVLVSRNEENLQEKSKELKERFGHGLQIKTIQADLAHSGEEGFFEYIIGELESLDISILVNNAGIGSAGPAHEDPDDLTLRMIVVNDIAPLLFVRRLIPKLLQREGRSAVINVGSIASIQPLKDMCVYSASKAFVDLFSRELEVEYGDKIDFLCCRYGTTTTKINAYTKTYYSATPEEAVRASLLRLGKGVHTYGPWKNQIFGSLIEQPIIGKYVITKSLNDIKSHVTKVLTAASQEVA